MAVLLEQAWGGSGYAWRITGREHTRTASAITIEPQYGGEQSKSMTTSMAIMLGSHIRR